MSSPSHFSLLVVDDEPDLRTLYELTLLREGYDVETAASVEDALLHLRDRVYSAVITDMRLPDGTGLELLRHLEDSGRRERAIVITAYGSAENAVEALKAGAYDYLTKPVDLKQFRAVVASALGRSPSTVPTMVPSSLPSEHAVVADGSEADDPAPGVARAPRAVPPAAPHSAALARMAGQSQPMQQVRALVEKVGRSMAPVLVFGESGTGKELVARAIHEVSPRAGQPFVPVNCSAIPEQLLEAEFFGYRKGAFTGAADDREGFFQAADGGTLFLDEIGDLPLSMQSKLLRAVQERCVRPVGAVVEQTVNVRLLSATHKDLAAEVVAGRFRQDLYYRLNVIQIRVPPLRERTEDLAEISERVLERIARDVNMSPPPRLTRDALVHLARYEFPGNVRELENLLAPRGGRCRAAPRSTSSISASPDDRVHRQCGAGTRSHHPQHPGRPGAGGPAAPARAAHGAGAAAARHRGLSRRGGARHPGACARAAPLQPHGCRRESGAVAAADALSHGAAERDGRRARHRLRW